MKSFARPKDQEQVAQTHSQRAENNGSAKPILMRAFAAGIGAKEGFFGTEKPEVRMLCSVKFIKSFL